MRDPLCPRRSTAATLGAPIMNTQSLAGDVLCVLRVPLLDFNRTQGVGESLGDFNHKQLTR
jgi:hypothetical protein